MTGEIYLWGMLPSFLIILYVFPRVVHGEDKGVVIANSFLISWCWPLVAAVAVLAGFGWGADKLINGNLKTKVKAKRRQPLRWNGKQ